MTNENTNEVIEIVDIEKVSHSSPQDAVKKITIAPAEKKIKCDVLIAGGGIGGVAAAMKLASSHPKLKICLTEETDWLGGQMTAQGVSALDENYLIETSGACKSYQKFRQKIRAIYQSYKLSEIGKAQPFLNPGTSWVTYLAFEPKHALKVIDDTLASAISSGALQIFPRVRIIQAINHSGKSGHLKEVYAVNLDDGHSIAFEPELCLDATELGDLLALSNTPYRIGSDSRSDTGESHAPELGNKENVQDFVYPFVVDFKPGTNNTIKKPPHFDEFNKSGSFSFDGYKMFLDSELEDQGNRVVPPFWTYRRLIARENFDDPLYPFDTAMINWDSNDLRGHNIIDQQASVQAERLALAKSLSLGFLYWMQTEAPRDDGGVGYPELELRFDVLGTPDGLSKYPYIREARRAIPVKTIVENDVVVSTNPASRARQVNDSLGIGLYPVDIHGMQEIPGAGQATRPFQIPLSALIPQGGGKLLPACKNIGVSHITNGAYRLHPIEWAIGEAQGELVAYCLEHHLQPIDVLSSQKHLRAVQRSLLEGGSPLVWFDDVPTSHANFAAIQYCALTGLIPVNNANLHYEPETAISLEDTLTALSKLFSWNKRSGNTDHKKTLGTTSGITSENTRPDKHNDQSLEALVTLAHENGFFKTLTSADIKSAGSSAALTADQLIEVTKKNKLSLTEDIKNATVGRQISRGEFANWLYKAIDSIKTPHNSVKTSKL